LIWETEGISFSKGEFLTEKIKEHATVINRYRMPQLGIGASSARAEIVEKE